MKDKYALIMNERLWELAKEKELSKNDIREYLTKKMEKHDFHLADSTLDHWFRSIRIPPAGALIAMADLLDTNVGYLIGEHDIKDLPLRKGHSDIPDISDALSSFEETYKTPLLVMHKNIDRGWVYKSKHGKVSVKARMTPYITTAKETGFCIDYCLGVTDIKYWQKYAFDNNYFSLLPENTVFYIPENKRCEKTFGILNPEKIGIDLCNGLMMDFSLAKECEAEILISAFTTNGTLSVLTSD